MTETATKTAGWRRGLLVTTVCGVLAWCSGPSLSSQVNSAGLGSTSEAQSALEQRVYPLARLLNMYERFFASAWPAGDHAIVDNVITDGVAAYLIKSGEVSRYPVASLPSSLRQGTGLGFFHDSAQRRAYYRLAAVQPSAPLEMADTLFVRFMMHENFHGFVQGQNWTEVSRLLTGSSTRVQTYPVTGEARAYREEMSLRLMQALTAPAQRRQMLNEAAALYQGWKEKFAEEARASQWTDIIEGSASYFEVRVSLLSLGADANASALTSYLPQLVPPAQPDVTLEAYRLGALAGLVLDQELDPSLWKQRLTAGVTPLEQLLGARTQQKMAPSGTVLQHHQNVAERLNTTLAAWLEPTLAQLRSGVPLLVIHGSFQGSALLKGFYRPTENPQYILSPLVQANLETSQGVVAVKDVVWLRHEEAEISIAFVIEPSWVQTQANTLVINHPQLSKPLQVTRETDVQGRLLYKVR